jgi:hypothetical protein
MAWLSLLECVLPLNAASILNFLPTLTCVIDLDYRCMISGMHSPFATLWVNMNRSCNETRTHTLLSLHAIDSSLSLLCARVCEGIASHEFQLCGCFILTLRLLLLGNFLCIAQQDITLLRVLPGTDRWDLFQPTSMLSF